MLNRDMPDVTTSSRRREPVLAAGTLLLVAWLYWSAHRAGFIWLDKSQLHDVAWLRADSFGDLLRNFNDWKNYFRPLVVALMAIQERAFGGAPGPMHLVSLALHLGNTILVGLLARRMAGLNGGEPRTFRLSAVAMLLYGLHPALIEPVVWISAQFDLAVTFFVLFGLLLNASVQHVVLRAVAVGACFFLAGSSKESACVFPLLLVLFDWMEAKPAAGKNDTPTALREIWRRQWPVYGSVALAGVAYLAFRYAALGFLLQPTAGVELLPLRRIQTVCSLLLTYWRILLWPMVDQGPLHEIDTIQYASASFPLLIGDFAAFAFVTIGSILLLKRKMLGALIIAPTIALLPVLHIIPVEFDSSLYHERYAALAVALACAILPAALAAMPVPLSRARIFAAAGSALLLIWLGFAALNIRVTLPLWSDEVKLWTWALREHPESILAQNHLLSSYLERDDRTNAWPIANRLLSERKHCPACLINVANLALRDHRLDTTRTALNKAEPYVRRFGQPRLTQAYTLSLAQLHELEHDPAGAEAAYRDAIALEPLDPAAHMRLALLLARQHDVANARAEADHALTLYAPDERQTYEREFNDVLAAALASTRAAPE